MNRLSFTSVFIFGLILLTGCADFPTKKVNLNFSVNLNVNTSNTTLSSTEILKANTNSDFDKYSKKINSLDINRITFTINSSSLPAGLLINNGKIEFAGKSGNVLLYTISNFDVSGNIGKETDMALPSQAALDELSDLLKNSPNQATIFVNGSTNKGPLSATINIKFYAKATARLIGNN